MDKQPICKSEKKEIKKNVVIIGIAFIVLVIMCCLKYIKQYYVTVQNKAEL